MAKPPVHTRDRLLDAAELLFDHFGLEGASTRQIATAADANSAAPNFHFSSKSNLIRELFRRRMVPLVSDRLQRLQKVESPTVAAIIDSFVDPLVELARDTDDNKHAFLRLLARNTVDPCHEFTELLETEFSDYTRVYERTLRRALPGLSTAECEARFDLAIGTIARAHAVHGGLKDSRQVKRVKKFVIAGLTAP